MPIEGHHLAFNGTRGRIEIRQYERQPWETPDYDEILLVRNFGSGRAHPRAARAGRPFRRRRRCPTCSFSPAPRTRSASALGRSPAPWSVLCGVAALESAKTGKAVRVPDLFEGEARAAA